MYQLHDFSVYHPNSYIASRRSSLPRQGYGGVYERQSASPWMPHTPSPSSSAAARQRELRGLPRHLSEYSFWGPPTSPAEAILRPSSTSADLAATSSPPPIKESVMTLAAFTSNSSQARPPTPPEPQCVVASAPEPPSPSPPPPEPASLTIVRRARGPEERRLLESAARAKRARGEIAGLPSAQLHRLAGDLLEMDSEGEERTPSSSSEPGEPLSVADWNTLVTSLVTAKKQARTTLDREYRDAKRQVTQMRHVFEKSPEQILSRFDRLVSDVTCYSRLVCHLARQKAKLGAVVPPVSEESPTRRPLEAMMDEKRASLMRQLAELPRLRQTLLLRQSSLISLCHDDATRTAFSGRLAAFWSLAAQLSVLESEIALDVELTIS